MRTKKYFLSHGKIFFSSSSEKHVISVTCCTIIAQAVTETARGANPGLNQLRLYTYKDSGNQQLTLAIKVRERSKQGNWQLISKVVAGRTDRQTGKLSRKKEREIQNSKVFCKLQ